MMDVILKRGINVESYEALMDVGRFKDEYKFLLPVLALSEEGGITDDLVNTRLFGVSEDDPRGRRLLETMVGYRLIEKKGLKGVSTNEHSDHIGYRFTERGQLIRERLQQGQYSGFHEELLQELSRLQILQRTTYGFLELRVEYSLDHLGKKIFLSIGGNLPELPQDVASELVELGILEPLRNQSRSSATSYYELTETGRRALQEGQVPVPEKGVYVLTGTTDPLFVEPVIACRPKEGGREIGQEFDRIAQLSRNKGKSQGVGKKQKKNIPVWLDELRRATPRVLTLAAQDRELIQIIGIDENINQVQPGDKISVNLRFSLRPTPEMAVIRSDRKKERKTVVETAFDLTLMDVMRCLFREKQYDFVECGNAPALLVAYEEVMGNPSEINRMLRTTTVHAPEIQGFGRFDDVIVSDLPLLPRTLEDAGNWARDCVINGITTYTDETSYNQLCDREVVRFSERFAPDQVKSRLPTYQEMVTIVKERRETDPNKYWFATAPMLLSFREGM
jgi:DNA-binding PadR family transcriptional regulator